MTDLEKLKKLIPNDHGYTDEDLIDLLIDSDIYKAAAFVLRGVVAQIVAGTYSFASGEVRIDKSKLVENYQRLIVEYEEKSNATRIPTSMDKLWETDIDRLSGEDNTDYADDNDYSI